ncbi:hypothetical protein CBA19CS22_22050 [Caballeronia novacaledonica]|uniref:Uncharacterized protein n=1 Tax=Caballeronia novacaledonica TaxID=1544861 RepID=A0ACB5QW12_9BURK|nr:hypothetical protein CBA19CS22_22050 [Caballeronia novacaledonica]
MVASAASPSATRPVSSPRNWRISSSVFLHSPRIKSARRRKRSPTGVRRAPRTSRSKSGPPASASSFCNCCVMPLCATSSRRAAARTLPASATATNMRNCVRVKSTLGVSVG